MSHPAVSLLCLPCAGASATMYLRWRRLLPEWLRLVPVELPGRGGRFGEPHAQRFDTLVAALCERHADDLDRPHVLFGHSMGALLAYGIAARRRGQGLALPRLLVASGSPAPARRDPARFDGLDNDAALIDDMRQQGGTPQEVFDSPELMRLALDTLAADYALCRAYRHVPQAPLPFPIEVLAGRADDIDPEAIKAWREVAAPPCGITWFEGGHFFIRHEEARVVDALVRLVATHCGQEHHAAFASA